MTAKTELLVVVVAVLAAPIANADICLSFGNSTDQFRGQVTAASSGGFLTLAMVEETFDRATYGSIAVANKFNVGLTKPTNTAMVSYACQIDRQQLSGPCQIVVITGDPLTGSRLDDVGFLTFGCGAERAGGVGRQHESPPGERQ
jgi:hypothetical protein